MEQGRKRRLNELSRSGGKWPAVAQGYLIYFVIRSAKAGQSFQENKQAGHKEKKRNPPN
jgi:hypothetical protein